MCRRNRGSEGGKKRPIGKQIVSAESKRTERRTSAGALGGTSERESVEGRVDRVDEAREEGESEGMLRRRGTVSPEIGRE